jgi:hypothetical protein
MSTSLIKKYEFNSGGNKSIDRVKSVSQAQSIFTPRPIGIKTPLTLSTKDDIFEMNYSLFNQLEDNFKNLIQTNAGEKLCFPTFGTNIRTILSKTNIENPQDLIMEEIQRVVSIYMPFITLNTFSSVIDEYESQKGNPVIILNIGFSIPSLSDEQRLITIKLGMTY